MMIMNSLVEGHARELELLVGHVELERAGLAGRELLDLLGEVLEDGVAVFFCPRERHSMSGASV